MQSSHGTHTNADKVDENYINGCRQTFCTRQQKANLQNLCSEGQLHPSITILILVFLLFSLVLLSKSNKIPYLSSGAGKDRPRAGPCRSPNGTVAHRHRCDAAGAFPDWTIRESSASPAPHSTRPRRWSLCPRTHRQKSNRTRNCSDRQSPRHDRCGTNRPAPVPCRYVSVIQKRNSLAIDINRTVLV